MRHSNRMVYFMVVAATVIFASTLHAQDKPAPAKHSVAEAKARKYPPLAENIERKQVTIWSDGTRMAADIYLPKGLKEDEKVPVVVFVNGTGGTKRRLPTRLAPLFVSQGYAFVAFDYRGWGESDSKLVMLEPMSEPDGDSVVTVKARAVRWQMDMVDQTTDVRSVISYVSGEKHIDPNRIGIFGTSYGGALVTWVAGNDSRVKCVVAQVPGLGGDRKPAYYEKANELAIKQARGETEPIPHLTGRRGDKTFRYHHMRNNPARNLGYNAIKAAEKIKAPTLIIDAGKEELMDIKKNGGAAAAILKANGTTVKYHIIKDIPHYGVYRQKFQEVTAMELAWFDEHLKIRKK